MSTHVINCGHCQRTHGSVAVVWACSLGQVAPCGWAVERWLDCGDGEGYTTVVDCGADTIINDDGWACAAGHAYVSMEARHAQGWDYASEDEALGMVMAGVEPARMSNGSSFWDNAPLEPSWADRVAAVAVPA